MLQTHEPRSRVSHDYPAFLDICFRETPPSVDIATMKVTTKAPCSEGGKEGVAEAQLSSAQESELPQLRLQLLFHVIHGC